MHVRCATPARTHPAAAAAAHPAAAGRVHVDRAAAALTSAICGAIAPRIPRRVDRGRCNGMALPRAAAAGRCDTRSHDL
jgi:hypothetical protein